MSEQDRDKEKEIIAKMTKYFVPIDTTDLASIVPESDRVLCSLTVAGKLFTDTPPVHILLTANGIAYRFISTANTFQYWHSVPSHQIKFGRSKITIDGFKMFIDSKIDNYYPNDVYKLLRESFSPYCKILSKDFQSRLNEVRFLADNGELLQARIKGNDIDLDSFLNNIQSFYNAGFQELIFPIIKKVLDIIPKERQKYFLIFSIEIYKDKVTEIKRKFNRSKKLPEMLLPLYTKLLDYYDTILDVEPNNTQILEQRKRIENDYNYYSIPYKDIKKSFELYSAGFVKFNEKKYEESLHYFEESFRLNPYSSRIKERITELQSILRKGS